jgi:hypothetical protein
MSLAVLLGRFFRHCITRVEDAEMAFGYDPNFSNYLTDAELADCLNRRGHLVNWSEVHRRKQAGEVQTPWAGAGA